MRDQDPVEAVLAARDKRDEAQRQFMATIAGVIDGGEIPQKRIVEALGITRMTLYLWLKAFREQEAERADAQADTHPPHKEGQHEAV